MKHIAIVAALVAAFLFFALPRVNPAPFVYDEADYMFAAQRGFLANYLDSPSYSFIEYVRLGLNRGRDPAQKAALSQDVRRSGDIFFYRHAHGPVYFYWLNALASWSSDEAFIRASFVVFPILTALAIYFGCLWILPAPQNIIAAVLATALFLLCPAVIRTNEVAPHQMFTLWFIVTLMLLAKLMITGERRFWYAAVGATALAYCTLEVTFVLIVVVLVCGFLERRRLELDMRLAGRSLALFAGIVCLVHPAALIQLAFAKSYLFYAYLAMQRKGAWGDVTLVESWIDRLRNSPVEWAALAAAIFFWFRYRDSAARRKAVPFLLFGTLMLLTMLRVVTTGARYVLPYLPAFHVFTGIVLSGVVARWGGVPRLAATAVIIAALLINTQLFMMTHPFRVNPQGFRLLSLIRKGNLESARLLVPAYDLPTIHYYFPNAEVTPYLDPSNLPTGQFDAIVQFTDPVRIDRIGN